MIPEAQGDPSQDYSALDVFARMPELPTSSERWTTRRRRQLSMPCAAAWSQSTRLVGSVKRASPARNVQNWHPDWSKRCTVRPVI